MTSRIERTWDGAAPADQATRYSVTLELMRGDMRFIIDAPFFDDPPPPPLFEGDDAAPPGRYPGLYKHECVEIFIASGNLQDGKESETPYLEIEIGPHGHFYLIGFLGESQWNTQDDELAFELDPEFVIDRKNNRWYAKGIIPFYLLPEPAGDDSNPLLLVWRTNCVAIHGVAPAKREYLSQNVLPRLNFHQLRCFTKFVCSDEDAQRLKSMSQSTRNWSISHQLRLKSGDYGPQRFASSDRFSSKGATTTTLKTIEQVLEDIGAKSAANEKMLKQNAKLQALVRSSLLNDETILLSGYFWKRKGWSHKRRILVLTSKPRLVYYSSHAPYAYKGYIDWSMLKPVSIGLVGNSTDRFDITLCDGSRAYHFYDELENGEMVPNWIDSINSINDAQGRYVASNFAYRNSAPLSSKRLVQYNTTATQCLLL